MPRRRHPHHAIERALVTAEGAGWIVDTSMAVNAKRWGEMRCATPVSPCNFGIHANPPNPGQFAQMLIDRLECPHY